MKFILVLLAGLATQTYAATNFYGMVAANAIGGKAPYTCRTQTDWNNLAKTTKANGFKSLRIVGFDCNALPRASKAAEKYGLTVLAGIYIHKTVAEAKKQIDDEVQIFMANYWKYGASRYVGLTIGNEVNDTTRNIMQRVYDVRGYLRMMGVKTPVSTVHTWVRIRDEPSLCGGDFVAANAHAFFDGYRTSRQAGDFLFKLAVPSLQKKCPGKKLIITESGWPSEGRNNSRAIASGFDERMAILNLNCACRDDRSVTVYAFEADNQLWKDNENERSFGIFGKLELRSIFDICN
ncbi:Cell surface mannoprotein MP65 [Psilocybe cubensis]|uniref:glucan endo-1,3-beta-D-glucosidase n=2 Tax=Psilocybe cubensis TaxID=181762 RepID=A0A8H7Y501_PSICU|nr:Cell surface mannoprotein MP65 [Psilocybe cubensis]KAH9486472.1 Cell surface mannoprotein MP65 [Psilocybe cubensis]